MSKIAGCIAAALILGLPGLQASQAQDGPDDPHLTLIILRADWCAKCQVLEPALDRALEGAAGSMVERIRIDLTHSRKSDEAMKGITAASKARLSVHRAGWIWEHHAMRTGLAWLVSARSGEPLACFTSSVPAEQITAQIRLAERIAAADGPVAENAAGKTDCPALIG